MALRARLGDDGHAALLELFESEEEGWTVRVLSLAGERYERRLAEEVAGLRVALVREIHDARVDTIKWAFLFWVGQFAAFAGLLAFMLRGAAR